MSFHDDDVPPPYSETDPITTPTSDSAGVFKTLVQHFFNLGAKCQGQINTLNLAILPRMSDFPKTKYGKFNPKSETMALAVRISLRDENLNKPDNSLCEQLLMFSLDITWENIITLAYIQGGYSVLANPPMPHKTWHKLGLSQIDKYIPVKVMRQLDDVSGPLLRKVRSELPLPDDRK